MSRAQLHGWQPSRTNAFFSQLDSKMNYGHHFVFGLMPLVNFGLYEPALCFN
jgi:hypothetical protein